MVVVELVITVVVSASAVYRCSAEHPSICGPSVQGDWNAVLTVLAGFLLLTAPALGCVAAIVAGVIGAARDPALDAHAWWIALVALSVGLLGSLLLIRHVQRGIGSARMQPMPVPDDDRAPRARLRLRDWVVVPGVLVVAGLVLTVVYLSNATDSQRHQRNAERATAIVQDVNGDNLDLEIEPDTPGLEQTVGVLDGSIYHVGESVPVLVDNTGSEPWVRLAAEPDDPTLPRQFALICFAFAGVFLLLRARRWWILRSIATGHPRRISLTVRQDGADHVAVCAADGSGPPAARLSLVAGSGPNDLVLSHNGRLVSFGTVHRSSFAAPQRAF